MNISLLKRSDRFDIKYEIQIMKTSLIHFPYFVWDRAKSCMFESFGTMLGMENNMHMEKIK